MNISRSKKRTRRLTQERLIHAVSSTSSSLFSGIASPACTKGTKRERERERREDLTWDVVVGCVVVKLHVQWKSVEFCVPSSAVPSRQRTQTRNGDKSWRNAAIGFQQGILWLFPRIFPPFITQSSIPDGTCLGLRAGRGFPPTASVSCR